MAAGQSGERKDGEYKRNGRYVKRFERQIEAPVRFREVNFYKLRAIRRLIEVPGRIHEAKMQKPRPTDV